MSHNHHPAIREHGLQDNCPRCAKLADDPFIGLDDDNLAGAFKAIRDEVAKYFGVGDGPKGPIKWKYAQKKVAKDCTATCTIELEF